MIQDYKTEIEHKNDCRDERWYFHYIMVKLYIPAYFFVLKVCPGQIIIIWQTGRVASRLKITQ